MRTFSKREALSYGWQRFKERPLFLIGLFIITTVISAISGFVADSIQTGGISVVVGLMDFAIQMLLGMGMTLILCASMTKSTRTTRTCSSHCIYFGSIWR